MNASEYFESHAIAPEMVERLGVRVEGNELVFPYDGFERRRPLDGGIVLQPKGVPLKAWTPCGVDRKVLICEGEGDTLAAASTIFNGKVGNPAFQELAPVGIPGASMNGNRLVESLKGVEIAFLVFDGDEAGRKATERLSGYLRAAHIHAVAIHLPDGYDLSDYLREFPPNYRVDVLGNMILDAWIYYEESGAYEERSVLNRVRGLE